MIVVLVQASRQVELSLSWRPAMMRSRCFTCRQFAWHDHLFGLQFSALSLFYDRGQLFFVPSHFISESARLLPGSNMAYKAEYKTTFEPGRVIQPIYTGGSVALSQDGRILASCLGEDALLSDLATGEHLARIEGVSDIAGPSQRGTDELTQDFCRTVRPLPLWP